MATAHYLIRQTCLNYYYCNNKQIEKIVFFGNGKKLYEHHSGWISPLNRSNNEDLTALEAIPVYVKRKEDLAFNKSFLFKSTLFINTNDLEGFEDKGEQLRFEGKEERRYGNVISFITGDRCNPEKRRMDFMVGYFTRKELTPYGKAAEELKEAFKEIGLDDISSYSISSKIIPNRDKLIKILQGIDV